MKTGQQRGPPVRGAGYEPFDSKESEEPRDLNLTQFERS